MAKEKVIAPGRAVVLKDGTRLKAGDKPTQTQTKEIEDLDNAILVEREASE